MMQRARLFPASPGPQQTIAQEQGEQAAAVQAGPLKIGTLPAADSVILHVAADEGLFLAQGLEVEIVPFQSALDSITIR